MKKEFRDKYFRHDFHGLWSLGICNFAIDMFGTIASMHRLCRPKTFTFNFVFLYFRSLNLITKITNFFTLRIT